MTGNSEVINEGNAAQLTPGKFYKRGSQEKTLHQPPEFFLLPAGLIEQGLFWPSAPWTR
jgi:hypothetical protein